MPSTNVAGLLRDSTGALVVSGLADRDNGLPGLFGPTGNGWSLAIGVATNTFHKFYRFIPSRDMTIVSLGHVVTLAATNDDSVDLGLFDAAMAKLVSTGLVAGKCNVAGSQSVAITPTALLAGTPYYFGHKYGTIGGTAATLATAAFGAGVTARAFGGAAGTILASDMTALAADALPATLVIPGATGNSAFPCGLLRET